MLHMYNHKASCNPLETWIADGRTRNLRSRTIRLIDGMASRTQYLTPVQLQSPLQPSLIPIAWWRKYIRGSRSSHRLTDILYAASNVHAPVKPPIIPPKPELYVGERIRRWKTVCSIHYRWRTSHAQAFSPVQS